MFWEGGGGLSCIQRLIDLEVLLACPGELLILEMKRVFGDGAEVLVLDSR